MILTLRRRKKPPTVIKDVGLEVNIDKTKYMLLYHLQNPGKYHIKIENSPGTFIWLAVVMDAKG
jgi:hypothetical protein